MSCIDTHNLKLLYYETYAYQLILAFATYLFTLATDDKLITTAPLFSIAIERSTFITDEKLLLLNRVIADQMGLIWPFHQLNISLITAHRKTLSLLCAAMPRTSHNGCSITTNLSRQRSINIVYTTAFHCLSHKLLSITLYIHSRTAPNTKFTRMADGTPNDVIRADSHLGCNG